MADSQPVATRVPVLVGLVACLVATTVAFRAMRSPPIDLDVFRAGGHEVLARLPLYDGPLAHGLYFTYTPLAAILFVPLAILPLPLAQALFTAVNLASLGCVVWLSRKSLEQNAPQPQSFPHMDNTRRGGELTGLVPLAAGLLFWIEPVRTSVYLGQVNLVLLVLVLWDLSRENDRHSKGIGVGIAAGVKLTPLIFLPYLLITRRFRAAGVAAATFLGTVAVGFVVLPREAEKYWLTGMFADATRVFPDVASPHNQSLRGMLARSVGPEALSPQSWLVVALVTAACVVGLAAVASHRAEELLALTLCGLCAAAVSPHAWGHHWVWLVPLAVFLVHGATRRFQWPRHAPWLLVAALLPLSLPWLVNLANPPTAAPLLTTGPAAFVLGNIFVLLFAAAIVGSVGHLFGQLPQEPRRRKAGGVALPAQDS